VPETVIETTFQFLTKIGGREGPTGTLTS